MKKMHFPRCILACLTSVILSLYGCGGSLGGTNQTSQLLQEESIMPPVETLPLSPEPPPADLLNLSRPTEYHIGVEDMLLVSIFNYETLNRHQAVRPDGKISIPLIGDIQAVGMTSSALRNEITQGLTKYIKNPQVDVVITEYKSNKIYVLGAVRRPGLLRLNNYVDLLEAISSVGGLTEDADLTHALLVRDKEVLPVDFYQLFINGDVRQNIPLISGDAIFIPNVSERRVFVLGEVNRPGVFALQKDTSLIEAISLAGGFNRDAQSKSVFLIRGSLAHPAQIQKINVERIIQGVKTASIAPDIWSSDVRVNVPLQAGDVIFVPKSKVAHIERVLQAIRDYVGASLTFTKSLDN